jgi:hypothetical protein
LKALKKECSSFWGDPIPINGFFLERFGSRTANLVPQAERFCRDFESRSEMRPAGKIHS